MPSAFRMTGNKAPQDESVFFHLQRPPSRSSTPCATLDEVVVKGLSVGSSTLSYDRVKGKSQV